MPDESALDVQVSQLQGKLEALDCLRLCCWLGVGCTRLSFLDTDSCFIMLLGCKWPGQGSQRCCERAREPSWTPLSDLARLPQHYCSSRC